jgi:hypothetical protein
MDCSRWTDVGLPEAGLQSISYNALIANSLMFNALLRNPKANFAMTQNSLTSLLQTDPPPGTDSEYVQLQLRDPFARRVMHYLVGCALEDDSSFTWTDPVSGNSVTWRGDLGLCPSWQTSPMDQTCQELLSACLLARNNARGEEVLISLRGGQDSASGRAALSLEGQAPGGEPCEIDSFAAACPMGMEWGLDSNCIGSTLEYPGRWRSQHIGMCTEGGSVKLDVDVTSCTDDLLIRVCSGIYGCDSHLALKDSKMRCRAKSSIEFMCPDEGEFTVMYANADPEKPAGTFTASASRNAVYPAPEEAVFPWQEGAFYGNLFCPNQWCDPGPDQTSVLNTSLTVEVRDLGTVYYHSADPAGEYPVHTPDTGAERDLLQQRNNGHEMFVQNHPDLVSGGTVYLQMYACISPTWEPATAYARRRLCAGPSDGRYCAAYSTGRCWSAAGEPCQCNEDDVDGPSTGFDLGDRDYGDCSGDPPREPWQHPVTVFLNDPCDVVPESEYADGDDVACGSVPLCRQTTSLNEPKLPPPWQPLPPGHRPP